MTNTKYTTSSVIYVVSQWPLALQIASDSIPGEPLEPNNRKDARLRQEFSPGIPGLARTTVLNVTYSCFQLFRLLFQSYSCLHLVARLC